MRSLIQLSILVLALVAIIFFTLKIPVGSGGAKKGGTISSHSTQKLVLISPHTDAIKNEFRVAFPLWYFAKTGRSIELEFIDVGGTSDCIKYVMSEFKRSPKGIGIDLFFGGGTEPFLELKKNNLLLKTLVDTTVLTPIPQHWSGIEIYDPDGYWYSTVLSGFGIVYNKKVVEKMGFAPPREWKDLTASRYATWIGAGDPRNSGTMHMMFEVILQAYGWDEGWKVCSGMAANIKSFTKNASEIPKMVARGDVAYGLAIDSYGWSAVVEAGADKVGFILPANLTVISGDGIGVLAGAPDSVSARLFVEFTLSEAGQRLWFLKKGTDGGPQKQAINRMSVRPDFYTRFGHETSIQENPFLAKSTFVFDQAKSSGRWGILNDLIGVALIDQSVALKKAWGDSSLSAVDSISGAMPLTESQCGELAKGWRDQVLRNKKLLEWNNFFEKKYSKMKAKE